VASKTNIVPSPLNWRLSPARSVIAFVSFRVVPAPTVCCSCTVHEDVAWVFVRLICLTSASCTLAGSVVILVVVALATCPFVTTVLTEVGFVSAWALSICVT
jgi:hypothetical protein